MYCLEILLPLCIFLCLFPDETPKESNKRKLALLTAEHSQDRVDRVRELTNTLARNSHVVDVGQMKATNGYNLRDQMAQEFKTAATVVIVNSGGYLVSACNGGSRGWSQLSVSFHWNAFLDPYNLGIYFHSIEGLGIIFTRGGVEIA